MMFFIWRKKIARLLLYLFICNCVAPVLRADADPNAHGLGYISTVNNKTKYPLMMKPETPTPHDKLPGGTKVRLQDELSGKYYRTTQIPDPNNPPKGTMSIWTADSDASKAEEVTVLQHIDPNLTSYLGFQSPATSNNLLQVDPNDMGVKPTESATAFDSEDATPAHWTITSMGKIDRNDDGSVAALNDVILINRATTGGMTPGSWQVRAATDSTSNFYWAINEFPNVAAAQKAALTTDRAAMQTAFDPWNAGGNNLAQMQKSAADLLTKAQSDGAAARAQAVKDAAAYKASMQVNYGSWFGLKLAQVSHLAGDWFVQISANTSCAGDSNFYLGVHPTWGTNSLLQAFQINYNSKEDASKYTTQQAAPISTGAQMSMKSNLNSSAWVSLCANNGSYCSLKASGGQSQSQDWESTTIQKIDPNTATSDYPKQLAVASTLQYGDYVALGHSDLVYGTKGTVWVTCANDNLKRTGPNGAWYLLQSTPDHSCSNPWNGGKQNNVFQLVDSNKQVYDDVHYQQLVKNSKTQVTNWPTASSQLAPVANDTAADAVERAGRLAAAQALESAAALAGGGGTRYVIHVGAADGNLNLRSLSAPAWSSNQVVGTAVSSKTIPQAAVALKTWVTLKAVYNSNSGAFQLSNGGVNVLNQTIDAAKGLKSVALTPFYTAILRNVVVNGQPIPELTKETALTAADFTADKAGGDFHQCAGIPLNGVPGTDGNITVQFDVNTSGDFLIEFIGVLSDYHRAGQKYLTDKTLFTPRGGAVIHAFEKDATGALVASAVDAKLGAGIYTKVAVVNLSEAYALTPDKKVCKFDGGSWNPLGGLDGAIDISVRNVQKLQGGSYVSTSAVLVLLDQPRTIKALVNGQWQVVAPPDATSTVTHIAIDKTDGTYWAVTKQDPGGGQPIVHQAWQSGATSQSPLIWSKKGDIPVNKISTGQEIVCALDAQGKVYLYDPKSDKFGDLAFPGTALSVAAVSATEIFAVDNTGAGYTSAGDINWKKVPNWQSSTITVGSSTTKVLGAVSTVSGTSTQSVVYPPTGGAPQYTSLPGSKTRIEVVSVGVGGGWPPGSENGLANIGCYRNVTCSGFAEEQYPESSSTTITLNPLLGNTTDGGGGVAWMQTSLPLATLEHKTLPVADRVTVAFTAIAQGDGGVQVVFGDNSKTNDCQYRVLLGTTKNSESAIYKKGGLSIDDNKIQYKKVYSIGAPNPLAVVPVGVATKFWVSYDQGLIIAGQGDPGTGVVMAWQDPNPVDVPDQSSGNPPINITGIGVASDTMPVTYSNIQLTDPVTVQPPTSVYKTGIPSISSGTGESYTWCDFPFRAPDRGTVYGEITGKEQAIIALAPKSGSANGGYRITLGYADPVSKATNVGLKVERWNSKKNRFDLVNQQPAVGVLDPANPNLFWVSYNQGRILVGNGALGANLIYAYEDVQALKGIQYIGFGAGADAVTVNNAQIAPPAVLDLAENEESYDCSTTPFQFDGKMTVVLPFVYKISQRDVHIEFADMVNPTTFDVAGTPQQGASYYFRLTVQANGYPQTDWDKVPDNTSPMNPATKAKALADQTADAQATLTQANISAEATIGSTAADLKKQTTDMQAQTDLANTTEKLNSDAGVQAAAELTTLNKKLADDVNAADSADKLAAATNSYAQSVANSKKLQADADSMQQAGTSIGKMGDDPITSGICCGIGAALVVGSMATSLVGNQVQADASSTKASTDYQDAMSKAQATKGANDENAQALFADAKQKLQANLKTATDAAQRIATQRMAIAQQKADAAKQAIALRAGVQTQTAQSQHALQLKQNQLTADQAALVPIDSYVYVDKMPTQRFASTDAPADVATTQSSIMTSLQQADGISIEDTDPTVSIPAIEQRRKLYSDSLHYINNGFVCDVNNGATTIKAPLIQGLKEIGDAYVSAIANGGIDPTLASNMLTLLCSARDNVYFLNPQDNTDQQTIGLLYNYLYKIGALLFQFNNTKPTGVVIPPLHGEYLWPAMVQLPANNAGSVSFEAQGMQDIMVCFAAAGGAAMRNTTNDIYEFDLGANNNKSHQVRIKSLDAAVSTLELKGKAQNKVNSAKFEQYWISVGPADGGQTKVSVGKGKWDVSTKILEWTDPYPYQQIGAVGFGSWGTPNTIRNVMVSNSIDVITEDDVTAAQQALAASAPQSEPDVVSPGKGGDVAISSATGYAAAASTAQAAQDAAEATANQAASNDTANAAAAQKSAAALNKKQKSTKGKSAKLKVSKVTLSEASDSDTGLASN